MDLASVSKKQTRSVNRGGKPLRLDALENFQVSIPPEIAQAGYTVFARIGVNGKLSLELTKNLPIGEGIDDVLRLKQARSVVASVEATAKRSDKIEETNKVLVALATATLPDGNPGESELKPLPNFHSERITQNISVSHLKANREIIRTNLINGEIKEFLENQITYCLVAIENYLASLMVGKKTTITDQLLKSGALKWAYTKLGGGQITLGIKDDPLKVLYPSNASGTIYLTPKECKTIPGKRILPVLTDVGRNLLGAITAIQAIYGIQDTDMSKRAEEFFNLRLFIPRNFERKDIERISNLPPDSSGSTQFSDLLTYVNGLFRSCAGIHPATIRAEEFFSWYCLEDFTLDRLSQLRPREQYLEYIKRQDATYRSTTHDVQTILKVAERLTASEEIPRAVSQARPDILDHLAKLVPEVQQERLFHLTNDEMMNTYRANKDRYQQFLFRPPKLELNARREVHNVLTPKGKEFVKFLQSKPTVEALAPAVANYLMSFRRQEIADHACNIMYAQLLHGGMSLSEDEIQAYNVSLGLNDEPDYGFNGDIA